MDKKTKIIAGLVVWGVANNLAAYSGMKNFQAALKIERSINEELESDNRTLTEAIERHLKVRRDYARQIGILQRQLGQL